MVTLAKNPVEFMILCAIIEILNVGISNLKNGLVILLHQNTVILQMFHHY